MVLDRKIKHSTTSRVARVPKAATSADRFLILQRLVLMLLMASACLGGWISLAKEPYSWLTPKRVFVQHLHRVQTNGSLDSVFAVGAVDAIPVDNLVAKQRVTLSLDTHLDTQNSSGLEEAYVDAEANGWEWQACSTLFLVQPGSLWYQQKWQS